MAHIFNGTGWLPDPFNEQDLQYQPRSGLVAKKSRNLRTDNDTKNFWESRAAEQKEKEKAAAKKGSTTYQELKPLVLNQYTLGSCVANAVTATYAYELRRTKANWFLPSRTFIYYNVRQALGPPMLDKGCHNRMAMKSLHKLGVIPEEALPYPFEPQEAGMYWTADDTQFKDSCNAHLPELSGQQIIEVLKTASKAAANAQKPEARKPMDEAKTKEVEGLESKNEIEKLRRLCLDYVSTLVSGKSDEEDRLLNDAWEDILLKAAQNKSALYPGIHKYLAAKHFRIAKYERLDAQRTWQQQREWVRTRNETAMDEDGNRLKENVKKALTDGHPVVFGFRFYAENPFIKDDTDTWRVMPLKFTHRWPTSDWGGHAVVAVGYDDKDVIVLNSWGDKWGNAGTFLMPWKYITDFAATRDFWILESFRNISNVDDEDIKDMRKDLLKFSEEIVKTQTELKSTQDALLAAKQKLAKYESTKTTTYVAPVTGQALTQDAIGKMKVVDIQKALFNSQKNLFEAQKQLRSLKEELATVNQKLEKYEPKVRSKL